MKIAQTFLETKSNCFLLFSTSQLHILTKSWRFWFTKYFPKKLQNPMKAYFYLSMSKESHLYLGIGDDLGHLFTKAIIKSANLGKVQDAHIAESSAQRPNPETFHVRNPHFL